jgi:uncharacterized membrane protein
MTRAAMSITCARPISSSVGVRVPGVTTELPGPEGGNPEPSTPRARWIDRLLDPSIDAVHKVQDSVVVPAWRRVTAGESRIPVSVAIVVAILLEATLAVRVANRPQWLVAAVSIALLAAIVAVNPTRINRRSKALRALTLLLIAIMSLANIASGTRLVIDLLNGEGIRDPGELLLTGAAIWLTNVIVFALWYWEFDRGGPVARALATKSSPDFLFPQMTSPELAHPSWEPEFVDYLYLSFTNAMAFSPTDVMPMSRWAKLTMLVQSLVSLLIAVLVIARAVNILH